MCVTAILQKEDPLLRKSASAVQLKDIKSAKIVSILKRMKEALAAEEDGVAIAAPQIGESVRIFVISPRAFEVQSDIEKEGAVTLAKKDHHEIVFINPQIIKASRQKVWLDEGCLSVRWLYGKVQRSIKVSVKALNEKGETFSMTKGGLLAQIFQHEIDHLDGVLFIDKAKKLETLYPTKKEIKQQKDV